MFHLRRAALRSLKSRSLSVAQPTRSFITPASRVTSTRSLWQPLQSQRRLYSDGKDKESPAEAEGETATRQPSAQELRNEVVEESIASPATADGAKPTRSATQDSAPENEAASRAADEVSATRGAFGRGSNRFVANDSRTATGPAEPTKILYVGNLYFDLTAEQLKEAFEPYGEVVNHKIVTDDKGFSRGFGYIEYDSYDSANKAIDELNQTELAGRRMNVQHHVRRSSGARERRPSNAPSRTLFIGNISYQCNDTELESLFRGIKGVLDVRVAIDKRTGQPRGFAHADFTDVASAEAAHKILAEKSLYGRQLKIDFGQPSRVRQDRRGRDRDSD